MKFTCPSCGGHQWSCSRTPEDSQRATEIASTKNVHPMSVPIGTGTCVGYKKDGRGARTHRCGFRWDRRSSDEARVFGQQATDAPMPTKAPETEHPNVDVEE